jgi:hypothetical protein
MHQWLTPPWSRPDHRSQNVKIVISGDAGREGSLTAAQAHPRPERVYSRFDLTVRGDLD